MLAVRWFAQGRTPTHATSSTRWRVTSCTWTGASPTPGTTSKSLQARGGRVEQERSRSVARGSRLAAAESERESCMGLVLVDLLELLSCTHKTLFTVLGENLTSSYWTSCSRERSGNQRRD